MSWIDHVSFDQILQALYYGWAIICFTVVLTKARRHIFAKGWLIVGLIAGVMGWLVPMVFRGAYHM